MENPRPEKVAVVTEVRERFEAADAALLTEYRGLNVKALADLRRQLPDLLLTQGYWESREGRLGMALATYVRALYAGAPIGAATSGAIKAFPHRVMARLASRRP